MDMVVALFVFSVLVGVAIAALLERGSRAVKKVLNKSLGT